MTHPHASHALLPCLMLAVLVLSACGGAGGDTSAATAQDSPAQGASPAPPPSPDPSPSSGPTYYFADCAAGYSATCAAGDVGNNSNPGSSASAPKRDLSGFNVNTLPAGSQIVFRRGGSWNWAMLEVHNLNATPSNPLVFGAYGSGAAPRLLTAAGIAFQFGGRWNNTTNDGGYTLRDLTLDGRGTASQGVWLVQNVRNVTLDNLDITGFRLALESSFAAPHGVTALTIRNSRITRNHGMGVLGQFSDSVIENNVFEGNNYINGSGFNHATYLSGHSYTGLDSSGNTVTVHGGRNITLRNNRYLRNSVVNDPTYGTRCTGGNMTFHGQMDNVLIEGNTIEQDAGFLNSADIAGSGCWLMSITQGYDASQGVEGFTRFVVRNNRLINGGNTAMAVTSAPGIVIEGNAFINQQGTNQTAINVGVAPPWDQPRPVYTGDHYSDTGDLLDRAPVVRNNTACHHVAPGAGSRVVQFNGPVDSTTVDASNTSVQSSTGNCARSP